MEQINLKNITEQARSAMAELLSVAHIQSGQVVVVGCSTSEVVGQRIGTAGALEVADALLDGLLPPLTEAGAVLAVQCCEHLNRALVLPRAVAERLNLLEVCALPHQKAGGSLSQQYYARLGEQACLVEHIQAHAGLDIGDTLIGMHLRAVAVPVRLSGTTIGQAHLVAARTRPPLIGGERAIYPK